MITQECWSDGWRRFQDSADYMTEGKRRLRRVKERVTKQEKRDDLRPALSGQITAADRRRAGHAVAGRVNNIS